MAINDADGSVDQSGRGVSCEDSHVTPILRPLGIWTGYRGSAGLELREDLRVDHVELGLDLVAPDVVDRGHVFVQDQMFRRGWEPLHPGLVLTRVQNALRGDVHHQRRRVLGAPRLISGEDNGWKTCRLRADPTNRAGSVTSSAAARNTRPPRTPRTDTPPP